MISYMLISMIAIDKENVGPIQTCALTWNFHRHSKLMNSFENSAAIQLKKA